MASKAKASLEERLWRNVEVRSEDECWPWKAGVGGHGYGLIGLGSRSAGKEASHRVAWRLRNGPIPKTGMGHHGGVIRHTCNNRLCCNPKHLVLGSQAENVADMWKPGDHPKGNARLSEYQVDQIRSDPRSSRQIAPEFGVSDAHIRAIRRCKAWAHLSA